MAIDSGEKTYLSHTAQQVDDAIDAVATQLPAVKAKTDYIEISGRKLYITGTEPTGTIPAHSTWINGKTIKEYVEEDATPSVSIEQGSFETFSGAELPSTTRVRTTASDDICPAGKYSVSITGADDVVVYAYNADGTFSESDSLTAWGEMPRTFTTTKPLKIRYAFRHSDNSTIAPADVSDLDVDFEGWR